MTLEDKLLCLERALDVYEAVWTSIRQTVSAQLGLNSLLEDLGFDASSAGNIADQALQLFQHLKAGLQTGFDRERTPVYEQLERIKTKLNLMLSSLTLFCNTLDAVPGLE